MLGGVVLACAVAGCGSPDAPAREAGVRPPSVARQNEGTAAEVAIATAAKSAADLNLRSPRKDLEAARKGLLQVQARLTPNDDGQAPRVAILLERVDAALAYRTLHERWAAALRDQNRGEDVADAKLPALRADFRKASPDFRRLDDALLVAERRFVQATNRLRGVTPP